MSIEAQGKSGTLYVVATPIGNLADMSPRAVDVLRSVEVIAAEDTRHSAPLLQHFAIQTPMVPFHEHNEQRMGPELLGRLGAGDSVAVISDAGTPLISDPGYSLVREAHRQGFRVVPVPGPSALLAALSAGGLPTDRFVFEGFLPSRPGHRRKALEGLRGERRTLVFYEAPHRILDTLADLVAVFGPKRSATLARELTKVFETLRHDTLEGLRAFVAADANQQRGEIVLVVEGAAAKEGEEALAEGIRVLEVLLDELPLNRAAALAARISGAKRNDLYRHGVEKGRS